MINIRIRNKNVSYLVVLILIQSDLWQAALFFRQNQLLSPALTGCISCLFYMSL